MAAPNIINASSIVGKTSVLDVSTVATSIVTNSNSSNKVIKLNSLIVSNESNSSNYKITAEIYSLSRTPNSSYITYQIPIPFSSSLDIISKSIYLEEGDSLRLTADANTFLSSICSYEEIS
jgi:hypothetical protein